MSHEVHPLPETRAEDSHGRLDWRRAHTRAGDTGYKAFLPDACIKCQHLEATGTTAEEFEASAEAE